ncbi:hypothetical protein [Corallococcus macrosporus]|uniref:hypothetical protein n=1 Tax=Corallococcus macrosporus TaxID=35 RepID=UPI003241BE47
MEVLHILFDEQQQQAGGMGPVKCGLCGASAHERPPPPGPIGVLGSGWECPCGARGVPVNLMDLDDAYAELLERWGLEARYPDLSPAVPVGESGLLYSAGYVDGIALRDQLFDEARRQGAEVGSSEVVVRVTTPRETFPDWSWDVLWARPATR